jgi:hypothetical protein
LSIFTTNIAAVNVAIIAMAPWVVTLAFAVQIQGDVEYVATTGRAKNISDWFQNALSRRLIDHHMLKTITNNVA